MAICNEYRDELLYYHHSIDEHPDQELFTAHFHDTYEILIIISGKGSFYSEGRRYPLSKGKIYITRPGETHVIQIRPDEVYERTALHFSPDLLEGRPDFLKIPFENRQNGYDNEYSVKQVGHSAILLSTIPDSAQGELLSTYILSRVSAFLCDLSQLANESNQTADAPIQPCDELSICLDYINSKMFEKITLTDVARAGYLSVSQLCRLFKTRLGTTVHEYIKNKKLIAAKQMLLDGSDPVSVSNKCGFGSYTAFYRAYYSKFNRSPTGVSRTKRQDNK